MLHRWNGWMFFTMGRVRDALLSLTTNSQWWQIQSIGSISDCQQSPEKNLNMQAQRCRIGQSWENAKQTLIYYCGNDRGNLKRGKLKLDPFILTRTACRKQTQNFQPHAASLIKLVFYNSGLTHRENDTHFGLHSPNHEKPSSWNGPNGNGMFT